MSAIEPISTDVCCVLLTVSPLMSRVDWVDQTACFDCEWADYPDSPASHILQNAVRGRLDGVKGCQFPTKLSQ